MQFLTLPVVLSLLFTSVAAHCNSTKALSETGQCKEITSLSKFVSFASNITNLDRITKDNATKIAEIQAKASAASVKLQDLKSNSTLMSYCQVVFAQEAEDDMCQETFVLQRFIAFAANTTAVASATKNNATKIANIELKASEAANKLQKLESNSTLQAACPAVMQKDECKAMDGLIKFVKLANNQTKLEQITKGNETKIAEIQAKGKVAQMKLSALQSNATFMAACAALNKSESEKGTLSSSAANATTTKKSGAVGAVSGTGWWAPLQVVVVVGLGMWML
jgi:hypothetical protein